MLTGPFMDFHGRNYGGGQAQNIIMGAFGRGPNIAAKIKEAVTQNFNAAGMIRGKDIKGISKWDVFQGVDGPLYKNDTEATHALIELVIDNDVIGTGNLHDVANSASSRADDLVDILEGNPLKNRNPIQSAQAVKETLLNYLDMSPRKRSGPLDFRIGQNLGDITEVMNRLPGFISMMKRAKRKGLPEAELASLKSRYTGKELQKEIAHRQSAMNPSMVSETARESATQMRLIQVDYDDLTPFEKDYARVAIPFYSFGKGITKAVGTELYNHPDGMLRQVIRAEAAGTRRDEEDIREGNIIPEYMSRGGMINLGTDDQGNMSAITSLGLMHKPALDMAGNPGASALGMVHPLLKFGVEKATGHSMYFDKPLSQLDPSLGRLASNVQNGAGLVKPPEDVPAPNAFLGTGFEHFVSSSPAARFISTAKKLTDTRKSPWLKALGMTSGLKYSIVEPEKRVKAAQHAVNAVMENNGARTHETLYWNKNTTEPQDSLNSFSQSMRNNFKQMAKEAKRKEQGK